MVIASSPERANLDFALFSVADTKVVNVPGIKPLNPDLDLEHFNCIDFVFEIVCRDSWYKREGLDEILLGSRYRAVSFLAGKGYFISDVPKTGSLISYSDRSVNHWGIFYRGSVISKFGSDELYQHLPEVVPVEYGDRLDFYSPSLLKRIKILANLRAVLC